MAFSSFFVFRFQLPLWVQSKGRGHEVALCSFESYRGCFVLIPKVLGDLFNNNRNILVLKRE